MSVSRPPLASRRLAWLLRRRSGGHVVRMSDLRRLGQELDQLGADPEPRDLATLVRSFDPQGAERLETLDADMRPGGVPGRWSGLDVFRAVDPPAIVNAVRNTAFESTILAALEVLRNMLVLVPVLLTWWGLRYAAGAYSSAVTNPSLRQEPFLLLWEDHFGKSPPFSWTEPTLSEIAAWDVGVLALILLTTLLIHLGLNVVQARREAVARVLERELQHTVWKAAGQLAQATTLPAAILEFRTASQNLLDELSGYNQQISVLAEARQIEVDGLLRFGQEIRHTIGGLNGLHQDVAAMLAGARTISAALSEQIAGLTSGQTNLAAALRGVGAQMALHTQTYGVAAEQLTATNGMLADVSEQSVTVVSEVGRQVAQFSADFVDMRDHLTREHGVLESAVRSLGEAAVTLIRMADRVGSGAARPESGREGQPPQLAAVQAQLQAVSNTLAAGVQSLAGSLNTADSRVAGASASFERTAAALGLATQNLNTTLSGMQSRLSDSATALGKAGEAFQSTLPALRSLNPINLEAAASALVRVMTAIETRQSAATAAIEASAAALREAARTMQGSPEVRPASDPQNGGPRARAGTD
jgi:hypothetical protein